MKLYTEEQVRKAIAIGYDWCHLKNIPSDFLIDTFIDELKPIELPSDEEIEKAFTIGTTQKTQYSHKIEGAIWLRDKIQGGNQ